MIDDLRGKRNEHWQGVYENKAPDEVSWFHERPDMSLTLIEAAELPKDADIIDVGGGASTLVDHLLEAGYSSLAVLDISKAALAHAQDRLGSTAERVKWIAIDVTLWRPQGLVSLWHDRAVLHFLTAAKDQQAYAVALRSTVKRHGWAIIAGFAPGGPMKCSGFEIVQHDSASLVAMLGGEFRLIDVRDEVHLTPWNSEQAFRYHLFQRR